jgi:Domain of unknown function (DUF4258)
MTVRFDSHALKRMAERGASEADVIATIEAGERVSARFDRTGVRRNFAFDAVWGGRR